jgi:hypothetical protein
MQSIARMFRAFTAAQNIRMREFHFMKRHPLRSGRAEQPTP